MNYTRPLENPNARRQVLDDIVRLASPTHGTTVIAHVDIATFDVVSWKAIPTRTPVMRVGRHATSHATETMWDFYQQLCGIAQEIVPARTWDGEKNGPITGELVTLVCRDGEAKMTEVEVQYAVGWRYSNHLTAAFHGEVFVVTPEGYASLFDGPDDGGDWRRGAGDDESETDVVVEVEDPLPGECLPCYLDRMLSRSRCDGELRYIQAYDGGHTDPEDLAQLMKSRMVWCDCQIFDEVFALGPAHCLAPDDRPVEPDEGSGDVILIQAAPPWPSPLPDCRGAAADGGACLLWVPARSYASM